MCHANPNVEAALEEMEAAAERLSMTQQSVNVPLFDLLFKLINMPQTPGLAGSKLKVLHTYTHKFMEFYMTECPDGVSIHTVNAAVIHEIAAKLRSMGDGLGRLLVYLGLTAENECLMEYVDNLAVAYDTFAIAMANAEDARDEFYDDDCCCCDDCCDDECGEEAPCYKKCGACECGLCCGDDDDDDDEDEDDEECSGAHAQGESVDKLFERLFGRTPTDAIPKSEPPKDENDAVAEDLATMFAGFLSAMVGDKKGMDAAANAAARLEKRMEQDEVKAKAKMQPEQPKPKAEEKPAQPTEAEVLAKVLSDMLGCEVRVKKVPTNAPRIGVREVRPGLWNFFEV